MGFIHIYGLGLWQWRSTLHLKLLLHLHLTYPAEQAIALAMGVVRITITVAEALKENAKAKTPWSQTAQACWTVGCAVLATLDLEPFDAPPLSIRASCALPPSYRTLHSRVWENTIIL